MDNDAALFDRHLRVIHACEKGATGVYWGHRLVAFIFFCDLVLQLTHMHTHEISHYAIFGDLIKQKKTRRVFLPVLWCGGGIIYGFFTALFGRRAIWKSTEVIEGIVEKELIKAAAFFEGKDKAVYDAIMLILADELQHKNDAHANCLGVAATDKIIEPAAKAGAYVSKKMAERL